MISNGEFRLEHDSGASLHRMDKERRARESGVESLYLPLMNRVRLTLSLDSPRLVGHVSDGKADREAFTLYAYSCLCLGGYEDTRTHMHTHTTNIHAQTHKSTHTFTCMHIQTCIHLCVRIHAQTYKHTYAHKHACKFSHLQTGSFYAWPLTPILIPGLGRFPGGGHGNPIQDSQPGKSHGQRSLAGYSPWGRKESGKTEQPSAAQHLTFGI